MFGDARQLPAVALPVLLLSLMVAGCSTGTTPSPIASASPSLIATAPPSPSAAAPVIPDGTYVAATMQVADILALINADTELSAAQKTEIGFTEGTTFAVTLDLHAGQYAQGQRVDGGAIEIGSRGTYAFPNEQTFVIQENLGFITTFHVTLTQGGFSLERTSAPYDEIDAFIGKLFFESSPFTLVP
jgi:hypothetical protein